MKFNYIYILIRWTVLGLGMGLLTVSLLVCGYVTHRMGVCLWAGPQDDSDYPSPFDRVSSLFILYFLFIFVFIYK